MSSIGFSFAEINPRLIEAGYYAPLDCSVRRRANNGGTIYLLILPSLRRLNSDAGNIPNEKYLLIIMWGAMLFRRDVVIGLICWTMSTTLGLISSDFACLLILTIYSINLCFTALCFLFGYLWISLGQIPAFILLVAIGYVVLCLCLLAYG